MKRKALFSIFGVVLLFAALLGGWYVYNTSQEKGNKEQVTTKNTKKSDDKELVVYFSATGTTEKMAESIAKTRNAELYEIIPEETYSMDDLDYTDNGSRTSIEQNDSLIRPVIRDTMESLDDYDVIFLGYPVWHGQAPRIISTFLEQHDFAHKTIIPFCTSSSSGIGGSALDLVSLVDASTRWMEGKRFAGEESETEIANWIEGLNLTSISTASFDLDIGKNKDAPAITLNSGYDMPVVGLGTYSLKDSECVNSVVSALQSGYRMIDTAYIYDNEERVGEGIRQSGVPREEVFITTKLYPSQFANAQEAIEQALEKFDVEYIDLMLLHHPGEQDVEAYQAMEQAVREGKIRSIGLSNWYVREMEAFLPQITITPALVQNEIHPYYQENDVIPYMQEKGIVMQGWYPLGGRGHTQELLNDEGLKEIANAHDRTVAQVILRWNLQKGVIVIPGSSNPEHIEENISIFDFELNEEEMEQITTLDRNEKHDWY